MNAVLPVPKRGFPSLTPIFALLLYGSLASAQTLNYLGQQVIPHAHEVAGTTVGGLSGLDYDSTSNHFVAISDDRSERQSARFYTLSLNLAEFNSRADPGHAGVRFLGVTTLRDRAGKPHVEGSVDPEAIRRDSDGNVWWASEGNVKRGIPPAIEKVGDDGTALLRFEVPRHYLPGHKRGVRYNLAFESLALADGKLYVGTENALEQDGPATDLDQASPARILVYDQVSGKRLAEHVYVVDAVPVPPPVPGLYRTNGLVELLGGEGMLLALERSYTMGVGNSVRIYRLDLAGTSNVADRESLAGTNFTAVRKTLLLDLAVLGISLDNLEGMSWGPRLSNGRRTLILISDNNFSSRQITQLLAFEVRPDGQAIAARLQGYEMKLFYADPRPLPADIEARFGLRRVAVDQLLAESDYVVPMVPYRDDTLHLIEVSAIAAMKHGVLLVNACRGSVVDEEAVADALAAGKRAGYAADVFELEKWARSIAR